VSELSGPAESLDEGTSRSLRVIAFAMGNGIALATVISLFVYARSAEASPSPQSLKLVNRLTVLSMAASFAAIVVSEIAWKRMLAAASATDVNARTRTAFVVRSALREGAALAGVATFFLACLSGVLRAYPAYWIDLAPAALFWSFLCLHWPSLENLKGELAEILGAGRA
jgi:hypothetical protein